MSRPDPRNRLCAHADQDGQGMHWLKPGEQCPQDPTTANTPAEPAARVGPLGLDRWDWLLLIGLVATTLLVLLGGLWAAGHLGLIAG